MVIVGVSGCSCSLLLLDRICESYSYRTALAVGKSIQSLLIFFPTISISNVVARKANTAIISACELAQRFLIPKNNTYIPATASCKACLEVFFIAASGLGRFMQSCPGPAQLPAVDDSGVAFTEGHASLEPTEKSEEEENDFWTIYPDDDQEIQSYRSELRKHGEIAVSRADLDIRLTEESPEIIVHHIKPTPATVFQYADPSEFDIPALVRAGFPVFSLDEVISFELRQDINELLTAATADSTASLWKEAKWQIILHSPSPKVKSAGLRMKEQLVSAFETIADTITDTATRAAVLNHVRKSATFVLPGAIGV